MYQKRINFYRKTYQSFEHKDKVSWEEYYTIAQTFFECLIQSMMKEGYVYSLPFSLGAIGILKSKTNVKPIDWVATMSSPDKKLIRVSNNHTENYIARFKWKLTTKNVGIQVIPTFWKFKASRDNQRALAKVIHNNNTMIKYYTNYDY